MKGKQYVWEQHEDNQRAFTTPSVIWQLGDQYEKIGSGYQRKYWRCGLCTNTKMLAMNVESFSTKKLITPERNRLAEEIIEASECLKNWWDRGLIQQLEEEEAI